MVLRGAIYKVLLKITVLNMCACSFFLSAVIMICYCLVVGALNPDHTRLAILGHNIHCRVRHID